MLALNRFKGFRTVLIKIVSTMSKESYSTTHRETPLLSFGIIADVQYADIEDGHNFAKTKKRYYRNGLNILREAVSDWSSPHNPEISFVLNLGDTIDGLNKKHNISQLSLDRTLAEFDKFKGPVHHSWGNHDFYNFSRDQLLKTKLNSKLATEKLKIQGKSEDVINGFHDENNKTNEETNSKEVASDSQQIYYDFSPHPGFRVVMLDSYEISMLGYDSEHPNYKKAEKLLKEHNPNKELNSAIGLEGKDRRWVQYNGGVGDTQLQWLDGVLKKADENQEIVIVTNHSPIYTPASGPNSLCWACDNVLEKLHRHSCVVAFFSGHDHGGGFAKDTHDITHITLNGVIEAPPGQPPYFTAHVYEDRLELIGHGQLLDRTIPFSQTLEIDFDNRLKIQI